MKKIINDPDNVVAESLAGFIAAHKNMYVKHPEVNGVIYKHRKKDKVSLVIGGGSGHEPLFAGFVGEGLGDAAACGNVFASPAPGVIRDTAKAVDNGKGILFVYGCYAGDNLNFDLAEEMLQAEGVKTAHVRIQDDVTSAPIEKRDTRRGTAGDVFVLKIAGAACDSGMSLEEALRVTEKANRHTFSVGVGTSSAQLPGAEEPIFTLPEDEIEYGMGLHGEKGVQRVKWEPADVLVEKMFANLENEMQLEEGDQVCVLVNGLGSTSILELSIAYRKVQEILDGMKVEVYDGDINSYCTTQEMGGFLISIMKLDDELKAL